MHVHVTVQDRPHLAAEVGLLADRGKTCIHYTEGCREGSHAVFPPGKFLK